MMILFLYEYAHYPVDYIIDNDLDPATNDATGTGQ
jgi:hypothetical protein